MANRNKKIEDCARKKQEALIDESLEDTFPSSDPPSWSPGEAKELDTETLREMRKRDKDRHLQK